MPVQLDHLILAVSDAAKSLAFYTEVLGFKSEEGQDPFLVIRVSPDLMLLLAPWGTQGGQHLAFALPDDEFEATFKRVKASGIEYGDRFDSVGNMKGPGEATGARGPGKAVYFFDPSRHLIEIRSYGATS